MSDFAFGWYHVISAADWEIIKDYMPQPNDFFYYNGNYYILDSLFQDEYDAIIENDLLDSIVIEDYLYLKSSVHFGS